MGPVVALLQPQPVPVDGCLRVAPVLDIDDDLEQLAHPEGLARGSTRYRRASYCRIADPLGEPRDAQLEPVTVAQLNHLRAACLGEPGGAGVGN